MDVVDVVVTISRLNPAGMLCELLQLNLNLHCIEDARVQDEFQAIKHGEKVEVHPPGTTVHRQHGTYTRLFLFMWVLRNN